jgi:hypothetical protein
MLERVYSDVIFTVSSFLTNCEGGGKKSLITVSLPFGASSNLSSFFIKLPPFSPVACTNNADILSPHGKAHRENAFRGIVKIAKGAYKLAPTDGDKSRVDRTMC